MLGIIFEARRGRMPQHQYENEPLSWLMLLFLDADDILASILLSQASPMCTTQSHSDELALSLDGGMDMFRCWVSSFSRDGQVLRFAKWVTITTEELVPGDVFVLRNDGTEGDPAVPCDALLIQVPPPSSSFQYHDAVM